jgi:hypothetical protein
MPALRLFSLDGKDSPPIRVGFVVGGAHPTNHRNQEEVNDFLVF